MISIFGSMVIIATSGKMVTDFRHVLWSKYQQNWSDFEEIMASKVGVPPLKGHISKKFIVLKVKPQMCSGDHNTKQICFKLTHTILK